MIKFGIFTLLFGALFFSCAVSTPKYNIPPTIKITHEQVMTMDFPTKKSVFVRFGTPTSKETFDDIENWYFKLSEVTNTNSIGLSSGTGQIGQNPLNPSLTPINRTLITTQSAITNVRSNSTTVETYLKFWFVNDSVMKWETFGVDFSRSIPNPQFDASQAIESQKTVTKQKEKGERAMFIVMSSGVLLFLTLLFNG